MKPACSHRPRASRGFAGLIELVIVAVIILAGVALYVSMNRDAARQAEDLKRDTTSAGTEAPRSVPGMAIRRAKTFECQSNLRQLRMLIMTAKSENEDGAAPASLTTLAGAEEIRTCPVSGQEYTYDPATGEVKCTQPGHEKY